MKVIIVGAGIGGLTLAAALAQLAPRVEVDLYERDAAADARRKGYAIGLKKDAGLSVLERLGNLAAADHVAAGIASRGRKAVLESRVGPSRSRAQDAFSSRAATSASGWPTP